MSIQNSQKLLAVTPDGKIGPKTLGAADAVLRSANIDTAGWSNARKVKGAAQVILNASGYPAGLVDGFWGRNTTTAFTEWERAQGVRPAPVAPATQGLRRIIWHWTAGGKKANSVDRGAYHFVIEDNGDVVAGNHTPESNIRPQRGRYAPHTFNLNSGSVGLSLAGMHGARERPFDAGPNAITQAQVASLVRETAGLCRLYDIPVTRETTLSHAEVQPTLKVKQRGKWDYIWLPGFGVGDPVAIGDWLRAQVLEEMKRAA